MSFNAMSWAVRQECPTPTAKLVLLMLANYADEAGSCYPSKEHLSTLCSCDVRTIKRALNVLAKDGFVSVAFRFNDDGKQTSNRYLLHMDKQAFGETQQPDGRGVKNVTLGGTNMSPNTVRDIQRDINISSAPRTKRPTGYSGDFELWWKAYPRNDGSKAKAFEAWNKATKTVKPDWLLDCTMRYAQLRKGKDPKFTPHATTWLNQARYETVAEEARPQRTANLNQLAG